MCFLLQVYQGRTVDGALVAIKVQRPDLLPFVLRDIYILRLGVCIFSSNIYTVALHSSGDFCCAYDTLCILSHHLAMIVFLGFGAICDFIVCMGLFMGFVCNSKMHGPISNTDSLSLTLRNAALSFPVHELALAIT